MHELALVRSIYEIIEQKIKEHNIKRVLQVSIIAGEMAGVEDRFMQACFETYVQSTPAEGAKLMIRHIPIKVCCRVCGNEYETGIPFMECPLCGNKSFKIIAGKELYIESLEAE